MRTKKTYEKEYRKKLSAIKGRKAGGIFSIAAVILISFIILYINNGGFNFENDFSVSLLRPGDNPIASAKDEICTVHVIDIGQGLHLAVQAGIVLFLGRHIAGPGHLIAEYNTLVLYLYKPGIQLALPECSQHNAGLQKERNQGSAYDDGCQRYLHAHAEGTQLLNKFLF